MTNNISTKTIKGEVFIIPNKTVRGFDFLLKEKVKNEMETIFSSHIEHFDNEKFVEIWCMTPEDAESNWACHGFEEEDSKKLSSNWPVVNRFNEKLMVNRLPYSLLKNKKEGDVITFSFENVVFELTCSQLKHRYKTYGKFEEVLERVI